jgi:hypothetical protein
MGNLLHTNNAKMPTCPSCSSKKTAKFMFWDALDEWAYVCREDNCPEEWYCKNIWVESDRTPQCSICNYPLSVDIRCLEPGYWCLKCDTFPTATKKTQKVENKNAIL